MDTTTENRLAKIEALLRKAESTNFPEEAEAYTAKAEALMVQWSIDAAMLRAETSADPTSHVQTLDVYVWKSAMMAAQASLLEAVVFAHQAQCVYSSRNYADPETGKYRMGRKYTIHAMPEDLTAIELLYASLQIQAAQEYKSPSVVAERRSECGTGPSAGGKAIRYKNSFMRGYASKVGARLAEIRRAQAEKTSDSTALVLFDQSKVVADHVAQTYGKLRAGKGMQGGRGGSGYYAGREAGGRARLGNQIGSGT